MRRSSRFWAETRTGRVSGPKMKENKKIQIPSAIRAFAVLILVVSAAVCLFSACRERENPADVTQTGTSALSEVAGEDTGTADPEPDYGFTPPGGYEFYRKLQLGNRLAAYVFRSEDRSAAAELALRYIGELADEGWETVDERVLSRYTFLCLKKDEDALHISVDRTSRTVRVIKDRFENSVYSISDSASGPNEATLIQLDNDHSKSEVGMGYVICLKDGRFVIIDGGHSYDSDAGLIFKTLTSHSGGGKPVIAMWIVSHPHADHSGAFRRFAELYGKDVTLQALCVNGAVAYTPYNGEKAYSAAPYAAYFEGARVLTPQTGDMMTVGGVSFEFLYTFTDYYPSVPTCMNNTSLVLRASAGLSAIFLGDIQTEAGAFLASMYGDHLKSDMVQFAHHGYRNGASAEVYTFVSADIGLWPSSSSLYESLKDTAPAGRAAKAMKKVYVSDEGGCELSLEKKEE